MTLETLTIEHSKAGHLTGTATNEDGSPYDLTTVQLRFEARAHYGDTTTVIQKLSADITLSGSSNQNYSIPILPADTEDLPNDGRITRLYFELQAATSATDPHPLVTGTLVVLPTPITTAP